jgi:hypothetical protein
MKKKFSVEQIVDVLKRAEACVLVGAIRPLRDRAARPIWL